METLIVLSVIGLIICFIFVINEGVSEKRKRKDALLAEESRKRFIQAEQKDKEEYDKTLTALSVKFGECTMNENLGIFEHRIASRVLVYEQSKIIVINSKEYKFSDILGYSLVDDATSETITTSTGTAKTSTGNMLGRAVVGGVLTGGLGAVVGAATAKKDISDNATSQTTTTHKYTLYINVNNLQEPTIVLYIGNDASKAQKLAGIMNVIIERNKA